MIELIFVIVIIGILAAVAIPKLAATRSDAEGAKIANNLATCIGDEGGHYLKEGNFTKNGSLTINDANISVSCKSALECWTLTTADLNGSLTVANITSGVGASKKCVEAQDLASKNESNSTHEF